MDITLLIAEPFMDQFLFPQWFEIASFLNTQFLYVSDILTSGISILLMDQYDARN